MGNRDLTALIPMLLLQTYVARSLYQAVTDATHLEIPIHGSTSACCKPINGRSSRVRLPVVQVPAAVDIPAANIARTAACVMIRYNFGTLY
ncbi:hypothetical protein J3F83DRAFT_728973 [Trichoderma novae-zelandiae]